MSLAPPQFQPIIVRLPALASYSELLEHVGRHLPSASRFVVLGESFSGPLAIALARREPSRVAALVLCNSFVSAPLPSFFQYLPWSFLFFIPPPRWVIRHFFVGATASPELVASVRAAVAKTPRSVLAERMRSVFRLAEPDTSSHLDAPVLVLAGAQDALVRINSRAMKSLASVIVIREMPGPHLLLQVAPERAWSEISSFLAKAG